MFLKKRWSLLLLKHRRQTAKFRFVEQIQGRTSIRVIPVCTLCETEHPGHLNVRGVLRRCVPNKELYPLRRFAAILLRQKAWLSSWHAFYIFYCLMAPCENAGYLFNKRIRLRQRGQHLWHWWSRDIWSNYQPYRNHLLTKRDYRNLRTRYVYRR